MQWPRNSRPSSDRPYSASSKSSTAKTATAFYNSISSSSSSSSSCILCSSVIIRIFVNSGDLASKFIEIFLTRFRCQSWPTVQRYAFVLFLWYFPCFFIIMRLLARKQWSFYSFAGSQVRVMGRMKWVAQSEMLGTALRRVPYRRR